MSMVFTVADKQRCAEREVGHRRVLAGLVASGPMTPSDASREIATEAIAADYQAQVAAEKSHLFAMPEVRDAQA